MVHIYPIIYLSIYQVNEFTHPTLEESERWFGDLNMTKQSNNLS
jgi:hypothetical protein